MTEDERTIQMGIIAVADSFGLDGEFEAIAGEGKALPSAEEFFSSSIEDRSSLLMVKEPFS